MGQHRSLLVEASNLRRPAVYSARPSTQPTPLDVPAAVPRVPLLQRMRRWGGQPRTLWAAWVVVAAVAGWAAWGRPVGAPALTQKAFDQAVLHTLETQAWPSQAARAYEAAIGSVVRVTAWGKHPKTGEAVEQGVGTGVVIVDKGVILTNLHVVQGADTLKVVFADGFEAGARVVGAKPESDLAVIQAHEVPDDLKAATMGSSAELRPGDGVVAVGHPFGIGPSVSAGVVSGLQRSFRSPDGGQSLKNLIQFDAAANPGNSGGPLVNMAGEVVGIVTAIYNPSAQRTFVGIGFAVPIESAASAAGLPPF